MYGVVYIICCPYPEDPIIESLEIYNSFPEAQKRSEEIIENEGFANQANETSLSEVKGKNERSLSGVLSEVFNESEYKRYEEIIAFIEKNGQISPKEAQKVSGKAVATVRRYLKELVNTGYIVAEGSTNNIVYKLKL